MARSNGGRREAGTELAEGSRCPATRFHSLRIGGHLPGIIVEEHHAALRPPAANAPDKTSPAMCRALAPGLGKGAACGCDCRRRHKARGTDVVHVFTGWRVSRSAHRHRAEPGGIGPVLVEAAAEVLVVVEDRARVARLSRNTFTHRSKRPWRMPCCLKALKSRQAEKDKAGPSCGNSAWAIALRPTISRRCRNGC